MFGLSCHTKILTDRGVNIVKDADWHDNVLTANGYSSIKSIDVHCMPAASMTCFRTGQNELCVTRDTMIHIAIPDQETMHECLVKASDVREGHYVKMITPDVVSDVKDLSIDDCKMAAYICRYGGFVTSSNVNDQLIFTPDDEKSLNFVMNYMKNLNVPVEVRQTSKYIYVLWSRTAPQLVIPPFTLRDNRIRRLPVSMLNLPIEKTNAILDILIGNDISIEIDSLSIIDQLQYLLFRVGRPSNVVYKRSKGILTLWPKDDYTTFTDTLYGKVTRTGLKCSKSLTYTLRFVEKDTDVSTVAGLVRLS